MLDLEVTSVEAVPDAHLAEDVLGVGEEVVVDPNLSVECVAAQPPIIPGLLVGVPATQDQDVGDDLGPGGAPLCAAGQAHRGDQVRLLVERAPGAVVCLVERVV
ncbi:hypothetical protein [Janibacter melonis]|uniref:hypothetical protein n=1 Tax=Janibacter melonis TaxID=262209 RepID=UPI00204451C8|nr:hypothetical protein [Janibacter melonis]